MDAFSLPVGSICSSLIFLQDELFGCQFLIETRASVFPAPVSFASSSVRLLTADGSLLFCFGSRIIPLRFGSWLFQLAPVSFPILGADFLQHHDLSVSVSSLPTNGSVVSLSSSLPPPSLTESTLHAVFLATPQCV